MFLRKNLKKNLSKVLILATLELGALVGVPVNPEEIEKLMNVMQQTKIEFVVKKDDPPTGGPRLDGEVAGEPRV